MAMRHAIEAAIVLIINATSANDEWAIPLFPGTETAFSLGKSNPQPGQTISVADISDLHFGQYAIGSGPVNQELSLRYSLLQYSAIDVLTHGVDFLLYPDKGLVSRLFCGHGMELLPTDDFNPQLFDFVDDVRVSKNASVPIPIR